MTRLVKSLIAPTIGASVLTVTRAGATATRINERGLMELCQANSPRFDYDPVTKACRGLLIEELSTNKVLQSQNFGATWTMQGIPTRTAAALTFGSLVLDLIGDDDAGGVTIEGFLQTVTFSANLTRAVSIFMKAGSSGASQIAIRDTTAGADRLRATITWGAGGVPSVAAATGTHQGTDDYGAGLYRFRFLTTNVTSGNTNQLQVYPATDSSGSTSLIGDVYAGGVQAEDFSLSSSYIPTTTATVQRDADDISTLLGAWFNALEGSLVVSATPIVGGTGSPTMVSIQDSGSNEMIFLNTTAGGGVASFGVIDGGVSQVSLQPGTATHKTPFTIAAAYKVNDFATAFNGGAVSTDTAGSLPTVTLMRLGSIGAGPSSFWRGWILSVTYYPKRLVDVDLQTASLGGSITSTPSLAFDFTGAALEAQTGSLGKPRIAWNTYTRGLTAGSVVASSAAALFPSDAPLRPETYEGWKPTAAAATWRVDFGSVLPVNYFFIVGSGTKVALELSQDASIWSWICGAVDLDLYASGATLVLLPTVRARYARVTMEQIGTMNVFMAGPVLAMERYVLMGYQPVNLSRETEKSTSDSRSGQFLGTTIRRMGFKAPIAFQDLTPSWVRANLSPFVDAARLYPYGLVWNPADFPEDVVYGRTTDDIAVRYMGDRPLMETSWMVEGFDA
jgi:hypothetical protein